MSRAIHFGALLLGGAIALGSLTLVNGTTYAEKAVVIPAARPSPLWRFSQVAASGVWKVCLNA